MTDYAGSAYNVSGVAGRYVLGDQPKRPGVNVFACRLRSISPEGFVVSAPVIGVVGESISVNFGPFGTLRGQVTRHLADGFAVELKDDADARSELAARITAFREKPWSGLSDKRAERRFMPAEPRSVIIMEPGDVLPCLVVDYSASGAAVSADASPRIGDRVTIGHVAATVVRIFDVGFAVRFDNLQSADEIEELLEAPQEWRNAVAVLPQERLDTTEPDERAEGYGYD